MLLGALVKRDAKAGVVEECNTPDFKKMCSAFQDSIPLNPSESETRSHLS